MEEPRALDAAISASDVMAAPPNWSVAYRTCVAPALREPRRSVEDSRTIADRAKQIALKILTVANFGRVVAQARELAIDLWAKRKSKFQKRPAMWLQELRQAARPMHLAFGWAKTVGGC